MSDLDLAITPNHQQLAARGALAAIGLDSPRIDLVLSEIRDGGMDDALAVIAVLIRNLSTALVTVNGATAARLVLERTILDAQAAGDE